VASARVKPAEEKPEETKAVTPAAETFTYTTKKGHVVVCGKPKRVLKLLLRSLLDRDEMENDRELTLMATAALSVQSVDGVTPSMRTRLHFDGFLQNVFADDSDIDTFMGHFSELTNPEMMEQVKEWTTLAIEAGCVTEDDFKEFFKKKAQEQKELEIDKVRS
jgi:hypothetical protein